MPDPINENGGTDIYSNYYNLSNKSKLKLKKNDVKVQVKRLIDAAIDPKNYTTHYPGWSAFW